MILLWMLKFEEGKKRKGGINWMVGEDGGVREE